MSAVRGRGSVAIERRRGLVLVRGGRTERIAQRVSPKSEGSDWGSFCDRIGWAPEGERPSLPDDYEDQLADRLTAKLLSGAPLPDLGIADLRIADSEVVYDERQDRGPRRAYPGIAAVNAVAVAAIVAIVVLAAMSFVDRRTATQPSRDAAPERNIPADAVKAPTPDVPTQKDASPAPAPSANEPLEPERDPGSRVARRARVKVRRPATTVTAPAAEAPRAEPEVETSPAIALVDRSPEAPPTAPPPSVPGLSVGRDDLRHVAFARASSFDEPVVTPVSRTNASFTLPNDGDRWFGVALPPASEPGDVRAGFGAMVQVEVGRALRNL